MNIYIHVEIVKRELDSKLLLGTLAATKGHNVIISDLLGIMRGVKRGLLKPGIYHTKSLTGSDEKIARHKYLIDKGFKITSIDEESGLVDLSYDGFAVDRYSKKSVDQSSAIFTWGQEDTKTLKNFFSGYIDKIHMTGSPRADLWNPIFSNYWGVPSQIPSKPYLLISSNCFNTIKPFYKRFKFHKTAGYFKRNSKYLKNLFGQSAESYHKTAAFIEAINYLVENNNNKYDIVLRPHPAEDIKAWKTFLEETPNVHIIQDDSISSWVTNAFAIMHNGCTTAFEATISQKPVVTYEPFEAEYFKAANKLGFKVTNLHDLKLLLDKILNNNEFNLQKNFATDEISKKIYIDKNELASERIIKIWESFEDNNLSLKYSILKFQWTLKIINFIKKYLLIKKNFKKFSFINNNENFKFPPLNESDILKKFSKFKKILKIKKNIQCKLLTERTILIK